MLSTEIPAKNMKNAQLYQELISGEVRVAFHMIKQVADC